MESTDTESEKYIHERLAPIISILQKVAMGDFSGSIEVPEGEDEFTELIVAVKLMIDDLKEASAEASKKMEELKKMNDLMVNREMKMMELKKRLKEYERSDQENIKS